MDETYSLMEEEARQSFYQLEVLMTSLDIKASVMIAIDAILVASLEPIVDFSHQLPIFRFLIILPLIISVVFAMGCLWPRSFMHSHSMKLIDKYGDSDFRTAVTTLAKTYAKWEEDLFAIYTSKFGFFENSVIFTSVSLIVLLMFFIPLVLGI